MIPDAIRKNVGRGGEDIACQFLTRRGYKVVDRNYRRKWGEIDIIAIKGDTVRFIEVKAVSREISKIDGSREMDYRPEELVHHSKLRKIARAASLYMQEKGDEREYQIDVVGVIMDNSTRTARCRLFEQVLEDNL
jgi:putative endonuclease